MIRKKVPFHKQTRHYTALVSTFLLNLNVFGLSARNICSPGFNCHGCPWATFSCPVGIIGYGFGVRAIPAAALGTVIAIALVLGRLVCGYACPFGLFQDLIYRIPSPKFKIPRFLRYVKYVVLILFVFALTFIFGFKPKTGFIRVNKPELKKVPVKAKKEKADTFDTLPQDVLAEAKGSQDEQEADKLLDDLGISGISGIKKIGSVVSEKKPSPENDSQSNDNDAFNALFNAGVGGKSAKAFTEEVLGTEKFKGKGALGVKITVDNVSPLPVDEFTLTPVYYDKNTATEIWRGEERVITKKLKPGESYTEPPYAIPDFLSKAELVILSNKTTVNLDYWTLFCTYCPLATLQADLPAKLSKTNGDIEQMFYATTRISTLRMVITVFVIIAAILVTRFFCRVLCPLGALYALFSRFALVRIEVQHEICVSCKRCELVCPVGINVRDEAGKSECIACGNCLKECPKDAIHRKIGL